MNPVFNEDFMFAMPLNELTERSFVLRVWDYDMLSKNDPIGEVVIPLWQIDLSQPYESWRDLSKMTAKPKERKSSPRKKSTTSSSSDDEKKRSKTSTGPPSLCYSVGYEQSSQMLVATVLQCR